MHTKKLFQLVIAFIVAFSATGGAWLGASAASKSASKVITRDISFEDTADIFQGNSGVYFPSSAFTAEVELTRSDPTSRRGRSDLDFVQRWTEVRLYDSKGAEFKQVYGLIYVYYNLTKQQRRAWENGDLGIYYYNPDERDWERCEIERLISTKNRPNGRLACVISNFGLYGMAYDD